MTRHVFRLTLVTLLIVAGIVVAPAATRATSACLQQQALTTQYSGDVVPVVLVHGWVNYPSAMDPVGQALSKHFGDQVALFSFDYSQFHEYWPSRTDIADCLALYIHRIVNRFRRPVVVIGHSMGGLAIRFASDGRYAVEPVTAAELAKVITIDTPHLGSPWGGTLGAELQQKRVQWLDGRFPLGGDAAECLQPHTVSKPLPDECPAPPYLPPGVPVVNVSGENSLERTLFGVRLYSIALFGDGIVPSRSQHGYPTSGPSAPAPGGYSMGHGEVTCTMTTDATLPLLGASVISGLLGAWIAAILSMANDSELLDDLSEEKLTARTAPVWIATELFSNCGHDPILKNAEMHAQLYPLIPVSDLLRIKTAAPPDATAGTGYQEALTASGGTGPYAWAVTQWHLPTGLELNSATGTIMGTPTVSGIFPFDVTVTDSGGRTHTARLSITVADSASAAPGFHLVSAFHDGHACAVTKDFVVKCWGYNGNGQLGNGSSGGNSPTPVLVLVNATLPLTGATSVSAGGYYSCALLADTSVRCWGSPPYSQAGTPLDAQGSPLTGIAKVEAGNGHTCVLMLDTSVKCWGWNGHGQLGGGTSVDPIQGAPVGPSAPVTVLDSAGVALTGVQDISVGGQHTCALMADHRVLCWGGYSYASQVQPDHLTPTVITTSTGAPLLASDVGSGLVHACALSTGGGVECWGNNANGGLGAGVSTNWWQSAPVPTESLPADVRPASLAIGEYASCVITEEAGLACWGGYTPVQVPAGLAGVTEASTADTFTCVRQNGNVSCWGNNTYGSLGDGTHTSSNSPVRVDLG